MRDEADYYPLMKAAKQHGWYTGDIDDLIIKCIDVKYRDTMVLYNYNDIGHTIKMHPLINRCRGLVLDINTGQIYNYPFNRFFNDFEEKTIIDWNTASVQEKLDGSLICVFKYNNEWVVTTRGSFYPNDKGTDYRQIFMRLFTKFYLLYPKYCYMFELISSENRIVTFYEQEFVGLLGMRSLITFQEVPQELLDKVAENIGVRRPTIYPFRNMKECDRLFAEAKDDFEGLVVVDKEFNRVKLKKESYLRLSKILMLSEEDIFNYVLGRVELDSEYLHKLPEVQDQISIMKKKLKETDKELRKVFDFIKKFSTSRKDFALQAQKYPFKSALFCLLDNKPYTEKLTWEQLQKW